MITPETALKLRDLGFPLISVGKEDHQYAADFCRFCGFPFLKVEDTYYLMPTINAILGMIGDKFERLSTDTACKFHAMGSTGGNDEISLGSASEPDEALCLLWIQLREDEKNEGAA